MNKLSYNKNLKSKSLDRIKYLMKNINSLQRMANSSGMTECFKVIKSKFPELKVHNFKPGSKAGDWTVPKNWKLGESFLKSKNGIYF